MCPFNHDPPLFLPPMVNSESAVVWLLLFHTWLHKTCGRLLPGHCPCMCVHAWLCDEILKYFHHQTLGRRQQNSRSLILFFLSVSIFLAWWLYIYSFFSLGMACRSGRQTSSGPMTELIHRSCRMKRSRLEGIHSKKGLNGEASLRCRCPLQPWQCKNMMKKHLGEFTGLAMFMGGGKRWKESGSCRAEDGEMKWPHTVCVFLCVWRVQDYKYKE